MNRREFIIGAAGTAFALGYKGGSASAEPTDAEWTKPKLKKAFLYWMLPESLSIEDRFKYARDISRVDHRQSIQRRCRFSLGLLDDHSQHFA